jgi:transcriptional regulator with XRE-family HTH domain
MAFGTLLRQWRSARGLSQLALATEAGISTRHLSFLETGRAHPSRDMVQLLSDMLDVPAADHNALLFAAGYAPVYEAAAREALPAESLQCAIDAILRQQEPYPALVIDSEANVLRRNGGARRIFDIFYGERCSGRPVNVVRTIFDAHGLRPYIVNFEAVAQCALRSAQAPEHPLVTLQLRKGDVSLSFFSTVTALGNVRVKSFFPADAATDEFARRVAALPAA